MNKVKSLADNPCLFLGTMTVENRGKIHGTEREKYLHKTNHIFGNRDVDSEVEGLL